MPDPLTLSVVIIARNEEQRIGDCLASVCGLAGDIVVVDACSTDRTASIAAAAGARVLTRSWSGFSDQKNFGNDLARYDWVLSLDADERVSPELADQLRLLWARGATCDAYEIPFQNYFGATRVRFGAWNPESHVRLFDRRKLRWNSDEVHEGLRAAEGARFGFIEGCIRHCTVASRAQLATKTERYSRLFAEKLRRQQRHPAWWKVWLNPLFRFGRDYVFRGGFLDGRVGVVIAWESARYTHLKYYLALPQPVHFTVRWSPAWLTVATAMIIATAMVITNGRLDHSGESADVATSVLTSDATWPHADDGFDNNSLAPGRRLSIDDEVVL